jgi:hypothetical protein
MQVNLDRIGLKALVNGLYIDYSEFNNPLVKKAGHCYNDQYMTTTWKNLDTLTDDELYKLYLIYRENIEKI